SRRTAGPGAVVRGPLRARAGRLRPAPQDAAQRARAGARRRHAGCPRGGRGARHPTSGGVDPPAGGGGGARRGATSPGAGSRNPRRVRATVHPKLTLTLRVLGRREDGYHELEALVVSLGQPHDVLEVYAVPAPGGVQLELAGDAAGDVPRDHRNLAFVAAE